MPIKVEEKKKEEPEKRDDSSAIFKGRRRSAGTSAKTSQPIANEKKTMNGRISKMGNTS